MGDLNISKYTEQSIGLRIWNWQGKHEPILLEKKRDSRNQGNWWESNRFCIYTSLIKAVFIWITKVFIIKRYNPLKEAPITDSGLVV